MKAKIVIGALFALAALALGSGCDGGREGDRCNPNLSHNDCNGGLRCQVTTACGESYCCPSNPASSTNPYCNGDPGVNAACPAPDGGAEADTDTGAPDTGAADSGGGDAASD
jgi:hypothetical protein